MTSISTFDLLVILTSEDTNVVSKATNVTVTVENCFHTTWFTCVMTWITVLEAKQVITAQFGDQRAFFADRISWEQCSWECANQREC